MNKKIIIVLLFVCSLKFIGTETLEYVENIDNEISNILVEIIESDEVIEITSFNNSVTHAAVLNKFLNTNSYSYSNKDTNTDLKAIKKDKALIVSGKLNGKAVNTKIEINKTPLYQFMDVSLTSFAIGSKTKMTFQNFYPEELKVWTMVATKQKIEEISIQRGSILAQRVKVTLSGFLSIFWSTTFWFDPETGEFLKYSGKNANKDLVVIQVTS